jgi:signal transduction histidine kinase
MKTQKISRNTKRINLSLRILFLIVSITSLCIACIFSFLLVLFTAKMFYHQPFTLPVAVVMGFSICLLSILIGGTILWLISSRFTRPIEEVNKAVKKVANGDFTVRINKKADVFAKYELINEMDELAVNFDMMTAELSGMDYMRKDFMSNVSHEIKTPVSAITGFTEILLKNGLSFKEQQDYLMLVNKESLRLSRLCDSMLRMSRLDHQQIVSKKDKVRVDEQIRKSIIMLTEKWTERLRNYEIELDPLEIYSDADLLTQVWVNLIDNAIKYSPEDSTIRIIGKIEKDSLIVTIQDEGSGIDTKDFTRIYEKFYQCDESHKKNGNGLGLSIVKRIIDLLGGTINCISEKEIGTIMVVKLPI